MDEVSRARELHGAGQLDAAETLYRSALLTSPDDIQLLRDYAVLLMQSRREAEAAALIDEPRILEHADTDLLSILALCLRAMSHVDRAIEIARRIISTDTSSSLGWLLLGSLHVRCGEFRAAEVELRRSISIEPTLAEAWHYLGESLQALERYDEAIAAYQIAARQQPGDVFNIAICHELAGRIEMATRCYQAAHGLMPRRADVLARLAQAHALRCDMAAAADAAGALAAMLGNTLSDDDAPEPFILSHLGIDESMKAKVFRRHCQRVQNATPRFPCSKEARPRKDGRIRIAYLSSDFGPHAIGELIRSHFAAHDRTMFHVSGYSLRSHTGVVADEIRCGFDRFVDCEALGDDAVAKLIFSHGVDVLVDMGGFTHGARPGILARRPAAIQLGWLGFIHGHQAPWLDALLMDEYILPTASPWPYEDNILRLDGTLFPGSPMAANKSDRGRFGLPEGVPVLASFNNTYKLDRTLLASWNRILRLAPGAHLMVYVPPAAREGFLHEWSTLDAPRDRLHLVDKIPIDEQSIRAATCDLLLDAFRYQGGATSMNALGSGLPVLALEGRTPLARLSAGLNHFLGLEKLVCNDIESYVQRAATLANDPPQLRQLRQLVAHQVAQRRLFDPRRAASAIEEAIGSLLGK